jgi:hypothetical protein
MIRTIKPVGVAVLAVLLASASPAFAHGKGKGHGYHEHHHHYRGGHYYKPPKHQHHHHHHHHKHKRRSSNEAAYLLGGIVLGSVLTHTLTQPRAQYAPAPAPAHYGPAPGRRLLLDAYGDCYERRGHGGSEVLIPLPRYECNW